MEHRPQRLYLPEQVRELDRIAIEDHGVPGYELMCRAGRAVFRSLSDHWPDTARILALCGGGNNGGDGYVVARLALEAGLDARVAWLVDPERLQGDARKAWLDARSAGVPAAPYDTAVLDTADVVVDALLGTGLERPVEGRWAEVIEEIGACACPVVAVDIPSGLSARTGMPMGCAVTASLTISFIGRKQGMYTGRGRAFCGEIEFASLDVPKAIYDRVETSANLYAGEDLGRLLPLRPRDAHKGSAGHLLVIGGNLGMAGAARMAAEAGARVGSGLVSVATRANHAPVQAAVRPEVMFRSAETRADLTDVLDRASVVAIGPGLGRDHWSREMLDTVLEWQGPLVVDADALNLLADVPARRDDWVLTPHPGEAARLIGASVAEVQSDRFRSVADIQRRYGGTALLKGAGTVVQGVDGGVTVCLGGNPGMASGGMGDVLTGVIGGLLAQGLTPLDAARAGAYLHGAAADAAALEGERGLIATDLLPHLRALVNPR